MTVSTNARVVLAWCATHQHDTATRTIAGKVCRVVNLNWHGIAQVLGYEHGNISEAITASLGALRELREAGLLAHYDEGPGTFGHSTLCFVPQD